MANAFYHSDNPGGFLRGRKFSLLEPALTVMAQGMGGDSAGYWTLDGWPGWPPPELMLAEPLDSPALLGAAACRGFTWWESRERGVNDDA